jgi:sterol desaturase/sphingolipid hydroxylase (fatty acid hydroxylase superfamily)
MNSRSLWTLAAIFALMAILALVESVLPFRERGAWRRGQLAANLGLCGLTIGFNTVLNAALVLGVETARSHGFGLLTDRALPPVLLVAIGLIALDFCTWAAHWSMHRIPWMWRVHSVHHADPMVDVSTSYRQHPLESMWRVAFVLGPAVLLGLPLEAVALWRLLSAVNALLEHVNSRIGMAADRALSWLFVTPNVHKVHHSRSPAESDTNFGNLFSIFDRALGLFTTGDRAATVEYGLDGHPAAEPQHFAELIHMPFRRPRTFEPSS